MLGLFTAAVTQNTLKFRPNHLCPTNANIASAGLVTLGLVAGCPRHDTSPSLGADWTLEHGNDSSLDECLWKQLRKGLRCIINLWWGIHLGLPQESEDHEQDLVAQ